MNSLTKNQKIMLIAVAVILFGAAASFFIGGSGGSTDTGSVVVVNSSEDIGSDLLKILLEIKKVKVDEKFFQEPMFTNLKDFEVTITPQPIGRKNPFMKWGEK